MSYEYAGSLFDTLQQAQLAAVGDWMTGTDEIPVDQAAAAYDARPDEMIDDLMQVVRSGQWRIPGVYPEGVERSEIGDLIEEWLDAQEVVTKSDIGAAVREDYEWLTGDAQSLEAWEGTTPSDVGILDLGDQSATTLALDDVDDDERRDDLMRYAEQCWQEVV